MLNSVVSENLEQSERLVQLAQKLKDGLYGALPAMSDGKVIGKSPLMIDQARATKDLLLTVEGILHDIDAHLFLSDQPMTAMPAMTFSGPTLGDQIKNNRRY